jgi:hypothetical protein
VTAIPGLGGPSLAFGSFLVPWYVWLLLAGTLTVATDYLIQTRVRGVVPLLETPPQVRGPRLRYALGRLGLLWITVLVVAFTATVVLWNVGLREWALFLPIFLGSIVVGAVLGTSRAPDIEGNYL